MSDINTPNVSPEIFAEDYSSRFMDVYTKLMSIYSKNNYYNPIYANSSMKKFNTYANRPTEDKLIKWLNNPRFHEQELRGCSDFLYYAVMSYQRSAIHFASILNFDYELIPTNVPSIDDDKKIIELYQKKKKKVNAWLKDFRVKEQCSMVTQDILKSGGKYYYVRNSDNGDYLQPMPDDYCYINGRTDVLGYTYALNMTFFYQFPESIWGFAPEFAVWYEEFLDKKKVLNEKANPYRPMPIENSVVFKFDDTRPEMIPPLSGAMKDSISIQDYKDLMKLKLELDTYQILYLKSPTDKDGKPTTTAQENINYMAAVQTLLPTGVGAVSAPMEMSTVKFDKAANIDNITGKAEQSWWASSGIAGGVFGQDTKSAVGLKLSIQADYNFVKHLYDQLERFLNYHISSLGGKFGFRLKFLRRNSFYLEEDIKNSLTFAQSGGHVERLMASMGYEPFEIDGVLKNCVINKTRDLFIPLQTSFTMSGKDSSESHRPQKSDGELGDAGDATRSGGYNEGKFTEKICLKCGKSYTQSENEGFCCEECFEEFTNELIAQNE